MVDKIIGAQRDFSYGEVDVALKRADDHPARKAGLRQMVNARILNSGAVQDRPGRRAIFPISNGCTRFEKFTIAAGVDVKIGFGNGRLQFLNSSDAVVNQFTTQANGAALPWTTANLKNVVYAVLNQSVYVTFPGMRPQVYTYDGVTPWTVADYTELVVASSQKRTPFYRISAKNITVQPSAISGAITLVWSSPIASSNFTGTRIRYAGRQILIGALVNTTTMNATVIEPLPPSQSLTLSGAVGNFAIGDEVIGTASGARGIVINSPNQQSVHIDIFSGGGAINVGDTVLGSVSGATGTVNSIVSGGTVLNISLNTGTAFLVGGGETIIGNGGAWTRSIIGSSTTSMVVQVITQTSFTNFFAVGDGVVGPSASANVTAISTGAPQPIAIWDEEVMNSFRGFPASVFVDQFRLGFCNFPALPGGILWSAINSPTDVYANDASSPDNSIFEIAPNKTQVFYVVPGPEGSEFVFCDRAIYYIPISATNPLKPGSVAFQTLSADGSAQVQPRLAQEAILYANAGQNSMMAIIATGAYLRPFNTKNLTEFHAHLFSSITAIACPSADGTFNERYAYAMNSDGSIVIGKYDATSLASEDVPKIGWGPWSGSATLSWVAAWSADVYFIGTYFGTGIVEKLDDAQYLDCALFVNALPTAFAPPGGKGPLWFIPSQSVSLIDQVTRTMGTYQIDANGFIIPQFNGGENLAVASLVAGQPWTMTIEPFCPDANPGQSVGQRMFKRRVSRFAAYVIHSTGFMMARLFSGPVTRTSPALGTVMNFTRFATWNQDDDPTLPPPQREIAERTRPLGRSFDPRVAVIKDVPGPLQIVELGLESTI